MSADESSNKRTIGLIAGNGKFPILFAQEARKREVPVIAFAIRGDTNPSLKKSVKKIHWLRIQDFTRLFSLLQEEQITQAVMAGQINPRRLFSKEAYASGKLREFLGSIKDKRADTVFSAIAGQLAAIGVTLIDSTTFLDDYLPRIGVLTKRQPNLGQWEDVRFGFEIAKALGKADVGQTVAIKDKVVVAVEAVEGTDATIRRAGKIAGKGVVIVKTSKPRQDMRFDIPLIGPRTIRNLISAKASCLAFESHKTLMLDQKECIRLADGHSIAIVAI